MDNQNVNFEVELEEEYIPEEDNRDDDDQLDDVVPCAPLSFGTGVGVSYDVIDNTNDGFYDDAGYTPTMDLDKMVDIAPQTQTVESDGGLEEAYIPQEDNRPDDDQLDDVV